MAYNLGNRAGDTFRFHRGAYSMVLDLARELGWQPAGTYMPPELDDPERPWGGSYFGNSRQVGENDDALELATALHRAIESIGGSSDGCWIQQVDAFARFCGQGAFQIC